ncbi:MAG: hypothetical protein ACRDN0_02460 [Trebonia sp.]
MGDAKAGSRSTRTGTKRTIRRRAVGTRDRITSHLAAVDEINDPAGMASTRLAEAVGYPGSSVAFAQLLSGMERDGLIVREIRGKRTYRITLPDDIAAESAARAAGSRIPAGESLADTGLAGPGLATAGPASAGLPAGARRGGYAVPTGFDYDELARRLLVQVVRRLASSSLPTAVGEATTVDVPGALAESTLSGNASAQSLSAGTTTAGTTTAETGDSGNAGPGASASGNSATEASASGDSTSRDSERAVLQQAVVGLERELATAWSRHGTLTAENARLREQLNQAQRDLARERTRRAQITSELNQAEVVLLEHLLTPAPEDEDKHSDAAAK